MYFNWLAEELGIERQQEWYSISKDEVCDARGGRALLLSADFKGSLFAALSSSYAEYEWQPWFYEECGIEFWKDKQNQRKFLDWFAEENSIESQREWLQLIEEDIKESGGQGLLEEYNGSLFRALEAVYSQTEWLPWLHLPSVPLGSFLHSNVCNSSPC